MKFTEQTNKQYGFLVVVETRTNPAKNETYFRYEALLGNGQRVSCLANAEQHQAAVTEGLREGSLVNVTFAKNDKGYDTISDMELITVAPKAPKPLLPTSGLPFSQ